MGWLSDRSRVSAVAERTMGPAVSMSGVDSIRILTIAVAGLQGGAGSGAPPTIDLEFAVTKYCLALTNPQHSESQIRVGEFPAADRAFELAELIAFDLGIEVDSKWSGWTVEVRSAQGRNLLAVPVAGGDTEQLPLPVGKVMADAC
jgi:hypothetical protein